MFIYGACNLIVNGSEDAGTNAIASIVGNVIYCTISTVVTTYYKDVYFAVVNIMIVVGLFYSHNTSAEYYTIISLLIFIVCSIILTIYKYRLQAFGYVNKEEVGEILIHHEYQQSIKRLSAEII